MAKWLELTAQTTKQKFLVNCDHVISVVPVDKGLQCRIITTDPEVGGVVEEAYLDVAMFVREPETYFTIQQREVGEAIKHIQIYASTKESISKGGSSNVSKS